MVDLSKELAEYYQGYSTETSLLQTYRVIFLALEAILFAGACVIIQEYGIGEVNVIPMTIVAVMGVVFLAMWYIVCDARSKRAEKWRKTITDMKPDEGTSEANFIKLCDPGKSVTVARVCLNIVMPVFLAGAWIFIWLIGVTGIFDSHPG